MLTHALISASALLTAQTLLQSSVTSSDPLFGPDSAAPVPATGIWAAYTPDCVGGDAAGADLARWPACAQPVRIENGRVALVSPAQNGAGPPLLSFSSRFTTGPAWPGAPGLVQAEVPGLLDTTYAYAALKTEAEDPQGRFTAARLWPAACPGPGVAGVGPEPVACKATTPTGVHDAVAKSPTAPILKLRWIAP